MFLATTEESAMERIVKWGIWGTGAIAHAVADDFHLVNGAMLYAVASRTAQHAEQFASEHSIAIWHEGLAYLLMDAEIDVIYIATPNHRHLDDCLACIRAGKAVLCEKPLALNMEQALLIADAARLHKVFCMEAMWTRFIPAVRDVKRRIESGEIGPPRLIQGNFAYTTARGSDNRLFDIAKGGGALLDRGVYLISLAQYLLGTPKQISGTTVLGATGVDEQSAYQLVFTSALADLMASLLVRGTNDFLVSGETGSFRICEPFFCADRYDVRAYAPQETGRGKATQGQGRSRTILQRFRQNPTLKLLRRRLSPVAELLQRKHTRRLPFPGNGYQYELMEVNRCLQEKRTESSVMPLSDSLEVMRVLDTLRSQWGLVYPQERQASVTSCV